MFNEVISQLYALAEGYIIWKPKEFLGVIMSLKEETDRI